MYALCVNIRSYLFIPSLIYRNTMIELRIHPVRSARRSLLLQTHSKKPLGQFFKKTNILPIILQPTYTDAKFLKKINPSKILLSSVF